MAKVPPAFQFYPGDFVMGTAHLDAQAIGCYLLLLCFQWSHIKLPNDIELLARICKMGDEFEQIWLQISDKFVKVDGGGYVNERLESVRSKALALSEKRAQAGAKGGQAIASHLLKQKQSKGSMKYEDRSKKNKERNTKQSEQLKGDVAAIVAEYQKLHPRSRPGPKELSKIHDRLSEGFTVDDLKLAIRGCHKSPFHSGENDTGTKYQTLELIVRDSGKVSSFIELAGEVGGESQAGMKKAVQAWNEFKNHGRTDAIAESILASIDAAPHTSEFYSKGRKAFIAGYQQQLTLTDRQFTEG